MKTSFKTKWLQILALLLMVTVAHAQPAPTAQTEFSQPELEQMLAPIALYPDALLSQVLMASTYPTEVVEASYWLKANPGLSGEAAVNAAQDQQWDISVKSLLPFPQILGTMETKLEWTENLGNAFLAQEQQVMDTIQLLRHKARAAGYLKSDSRIRVSEANRLISIELVKPTAVYVPYYNPGVVYGTWSQPAYAPVYWDPWPGYAVAPGYYGWAWAPVATVVAVGVLYGAFNWRSHRVYYGRNVNYWQRHPSYDHYRSRGTGLTEWRHDARHRRDIPYRSATVNQRFGQTARTYNAKVGPRPTVTDIRTGRHKIAPVGTAGARTLGATATTPTSRTGVSAPTGARTLGASAPTTTRRTGVSAPTGVRTLGASATTTTRRDRVSAPTGARAVGASTVTTTRRTGVSAPTGAKNLGASAPTTTRRTRVSTPAGARAVGASPATTTRRTGVSVPTGARAVGASPATTTRRTGVSVPTGARTQGASAPVRRSGVSANAGRNVTGNTGGRTAPSARQSNAGAKPVPSAPKERPKAPVIKSSD